MILDFIIDFILFYMFINDLTEYKESAYLIFREWKICILADILFDKFRIPSCFKL